MNSASTYMKFWKNLGRTGNSVLVVSTYERGDNLPRSLSHMRIWSPLGRVASYLKLILKMPAIIKRYQPDILISHYVATRGVIGFLSGFRPHMVVVMGSDIYRSGKAFKPLIWLVLLTADLITVKDTGARDFLLNNYSSVPTLAGKLVVKLHGFIGNVFSLEVRKKGSPRTRVLKEFGIAKSHKYIFSPRCMRSVYNQEIILRAFSLIKNEYPEYKMIMLCCNNPDSEYLRELRILEEDLEISGGVIWIARLLSEEEMADIFSFSEVFMNIPKSDQLAATLTEGIACGCFPIASNLPAYDLVIENGVNGLLVNPTTIAVANAFRDFVSNRDYYVPAALENARSVRDVVGMNDKYLDWIEQMARRIICRFRNR